MKQSLCFMDLLFCTVLRDIRGYERKKGEREKKKKRKRIAQRKMLERYVNAGTLVSSFSRSNFRSRVGLMGFRCLLVFL